MQGDQCKFLDENKEAWPCPHYGCANHCHKHPNYGLERCAQCRQWKKCVTFTEGQDVSDGEHCEFNTEIELSVCAECLKEAWEELA